ncbi:MAG: VCBS repeat-containing protein [Candidatus Riflebacteria bacterium]|nr:VCBS repeat-containing protein [Candidatus Riflebacteria bacterium]
MKKFGKPGFLFLIFILTASYMNAQSGSQFKGFSSKITGDIYSQVKVFEDLDGDGKKDLIFGATDGQVHVFSAKGTEIMGGLWPKQTGGPILAEVNVADLDGDGNKEVVVGSYDGKVYGLNSFGKELWKVDTRGTIQLSSPEIGDVEGNGQLSILVGSRSGKVLRIDSSGSLLWEVPMSTKVSSRITLADLDGDGGKEVICKDDNGKVSVFNKNGCNNYGWPQSTVPNQEWPFEVSSADLDGDGNKEVFTTTPEKNLLVWSSKGNLLQTVNLTDGAHCSPKVADLYGNGKLQFILSQADGQINVLDRDGKSLPGFPYKTGHSIYSAPQIVDVDGNGTLDIAFTAWNPNGTGSQAGYVMVVDRTGQPIAGYPKFIGKSIAPLTFADLDGDGYLEMIAAGGINYTDKQLHVFPTNSRTQIKMAILGSEISF